MAQIDFSAMPVGCSWTTTFSDGQSVTETYLGQAKGKYKTTVTQAGNAKAVIRTMLYDKRGRMVRKDWADGNWETFTPYSCYSEPGNCTYRYKNSDGVSQKIASETQKQGKGYLVKAGPVGGKAYNDDYFEIGAFGLKTKQKSENYASRLTAMDNCEPQS
ncbi:hypothetical protein EI545_09245 [Tabrizicola piscis]|uniref:Uncharacterized protein n=1 Tax=Tabrizicola piscis TaxID=2494374 RepID=A0A3S8U5V0_9RHOB|nr:hypothetical protein [Tabrizicola piscis]AZL59006.1 hypothetical protein EI545_09245 [Tabrizicola piscis]